MVTSHFFAKMFGIKSATIVRKNSILHEIETYLCSHVLVVCSTTSQAEEKLSCCQFLMTTNKTIIWSHADFYFVVKGSQNTDVNT